MDDEQSQHSPVQLSISQCTAMACLMEASAPKPGNVHRSADFDDTTFYDFQKSAVAIAPVLENAIHCSLGSTILKAITQTNSIVGKNTNLGIVLLLAPLAKVPRDESLKTGIGKILKNSTAEDAKLIYQAISLAKPGGIGKASKHDVSDTAPDSILTAMELAKDRDMIARQFTNDFSELFEFVYPSLCRNFENSEDLVDSIIRTHVETMAEFPDSLIARKNGTELAIKSSKIAKSVLASGEMGSESYLIALSELDFWLRQDGNKRNPGTTADLIAASLFIGYRESVGFLN